MRIQTQDHREIVFCGIRILKVRIPDANVDFVPALDSQG